MTTSWKEVYNKLKYSGMMNNGRSDETSTNSDADSGTPNNFHHRSSLDQEWQMNYIINRGDGLPKVRRDKDKGKEKSKDNKPSWNTGGTKSRIDTNMVKLKLLDATRKAIIEKDKQKKQLVSTAMQTDTIKTKLCKDKLIDNQNDLINPKDAQTETDVDLIALKTKDGQVIVTSSIAVNTEKQLSHTVSTQTVMPRSNVSFKKLNDSRHKIQYDDEDLGSEDEEAELCLEKIERRLKAKKKLSRQKSTQKSNIEIIIEDDLAGIIQSETIPAELPNRNKTSDSEYEDSIQGDETVVRINKQKPSDATFNSWNDLDFEEEKVELPKKYFMEGGPTPWSNFESLVLGQRFLNARLSPAPERVSRSKVTWSDSQVKIVNDLMHEASALMDMFDQVAMLLGPDIKLHKISDVDDFILPPSKYNDEMTKSCEKLEESLKRLQNIQDSVK